MTPCVDRLEIKVDRVDAKVDRLALDVAELKGKVSQLPTVWQVIMANAGLAVAISGLVFSIARAMR